MGGRVKCFIYIRKINIFENVLKYYDQNREIEKDILVSPSFLIRMIAIKED